MPKKGWTVLTISDSTNIDLNLVKLDMGARSSHDALKRLIRYYRTGRT